MLKQHNIDNADIPKPFEELAPEPLIQQHKAVVQAETDAKNARAATNLKKEREKVRVSFTMFGEDNFPPSIRINKLHKVADINEYHVRGEEKGT